MWKYLQAHKDFFKSQKSVIIGDFNSNKRWDKWDRWWNHSDVVSELEELNITSLYHYKLKEEQGSETTPTFYMHRNLNKPYHIDYAFVSKNLINDHHLLEIGNVDKWLSISDHMPVKIELI
jgi:endonuclease/exonuclease/phosphatase family metal-dependent hydrolase